MLKKPILRGRLSRAVERTGNSKLGDAAATYVSKITCPVECPLLNNGCYAQGGRVALQTRELNSDTEGYTPKDAAIEEAGFIRTLAALTRRPLRLHVDGDSPTDECASIVGEAAEEYHGWVWTYTHAWRRVKRISWRKKVSVLASCENMGQVEKAHKRGYGAAIVVPDFPNGKKAWKEGDFTLIPCPNMSDKTITCTDCRLCFNDTGLHERKAVIAFKVHGNRKKRAIEVIQEAFK